MTQSKKMKSKQVKVTQIRSTFGRKPEHAQCVKGLGLRRIRDSVVIDDTACNRGMINKVIYLLNVEEI